MESNALEQGGSYWTSTCPTLMSPSLHRVYWALTKCQALLGGGVTERNEATQVASKTEWVGEIREGFLEEVTFLQMLKHEFTRENQWR